jgi:predicted RNA binding protein YcfA (HicA-like mRNA interferase family)
MFKPAPTKCWVKFLTFKGFTCVRISASHHQYKKSGYRTIPVWGDEKQIPAQHIKQSCTSMGIKPDDFYNWASENC